MKTETYIVNLKCDNCNHLVYNEQRDLGIEIPKGVRIEQFAHELECEVCGCKGCIVPTTLN